MRQNTKMSRLLKAKEVDTGTKLSFEIFSMDVSAQNVGMANVEPSDTSVKTDKLSEPWPCCVGTWPR